MGTFGEKLLIPHSSGIYKLPKLHKLDYVSRGNSAATPQHGLVRVQIFHCREVLVSDADDNDAHGEIRGIDDGIFCIINVRYDTVCNYKQDKILPAILVCICEFSHMIDDRREICGPVKGDCL